MLGLPSPSSSLLEISIEKPTMYIVYASNAAELRVWSNMLSPVAVALPVGFFPTKESQLSFCPKRKDNLHLSVSHSLGKETEKKHCQRHNGPRILSPKLELSLKDETNADSNLAL